MPRRYPDTDTLTAKVRTLEDRNLTDRRRIRALENQVELLEAALIALAMSAIERMQAGNAHSDPSLETTRSVVAANKELAGSDPRTERRQEIQRFLQHMNWQSDQAVQMIRKYPWLAHLLARKEKSAPLPEFAALERKGKQQERSNNHSGTHKESSSERGHSPSGRRAYGALRPIKPHHHHHVPLASTEHKEAIAPVENRQDDMDQAQPRASNRAISPTL